MIKPQLLLGLLPLILLAVALTWGSNEPFVTLHPSGGFRQNGEYFSQNSSLATTRRYGSWSGADSNTGSLRSDPFRCGFALAFLVDGYPSHEGETIELERLTDGERYQLVVLHTPGEAWTRVALRVPLSWVGQPVRLRAVDASTQFQGWLGIADVRPASYLELIWIDVVARWSTVGWLLLASVVLFALTAFVHEPRSTIGRFIRSPAPFLAAVGATILYFRIPVITSGTLLNLDEAQMTAQAITFVHHHIPWADFDGTTSGPLNTIVLALPELMRVTPTLASSRFIAVILLFAILCCVYIILRRFWGDLSARVGILLPLALICGCTDASFVQYTSELVPMFLTALALVCLVNLCGQHGARPWLHVVLGTTIGSLIFAKLQAAPLALLLALTSIAAIQIGVPRIQRRNAWLLFGLGLVIAPTVILGTVAVNGAFYDFLVTYVIFPKYYVSGNCCHFAGLRYFLFDPSFATFFGVALFLAVTLGVGTEFAYRCGHGSGKRSAVVPLAFSITMAIVAIYMIEAPQTPFIHYLSFLIIPVTGIVGSLIGSFAAALARLKVPRPLAFSALLAIAATSLLPAAYGALSANQYLGHDLLQVQQPLDSVVPALRANIRPGQRVAMWGWMPQYLVYTGAVMGTRDSISQFQIEPRPFRTYYRDRYLRDFLRNRPQFLIEAIGPAMFAYHDSATQGIVSFPELNTVVRDDYRVVFDANGVRLFQRRDLVSVKPRSS